MKKYHQIVIIVIILLCSITSYTYYKNCLYGNSSKEIISSLSKLYNSEIDIVDIIEIDNTKVVAFVSNQDTGIATFIKNKNNQYKYLESEIGKSNYIVHYGNIDTKIMCATIVENKNVSSVLLKKDNIVEKKWEIKKSKPILIYYNDESIQNTAFDFEFIYLDSEGNKIERY